MSTEKMKCPRCNAPLSKRMTPRLVLKDNSLDVEFEHTGYRCKACSYACDKFTQHKVEIEN